jgi:hypothetical protein
MENRHLIHGPEKDVKDGPVSAAGAKDQGQRALAKILLSQRIHKKFSFFFSPQRAQRRNQKVKNQTLKIFPF